MARLSPLGCRYRVEVAVERAEVWFARHRLGEVFFSREIVHLAQGLPSDHGACIEVHLNGIGCWMRPVKDLRGIPSCSRSQAWFDGPSRSLIVRWENTHGGRGGLNLRSYQPQNFETGWKARIVAHVVLGSRE